MSDTKRPWLMGSRRARLTAAGAAALLVGGFAMTPMAFGDAAPGKYPAAEIHRPSPVPDRIMLTPTTTPATSQRVTWRAEASAAWAQAEILEAPAALGEVAPAAGAVTSVRALSTTPVNTSLGYASTYHTVEFTGLKPNTRYTYRVGDGTNWSAWTDFTTAAADLQPFSFIYYGDAQNYIDSAVPRVFRQAFADRPEARLIVNAGDLIDSANSEEQWGQWYQAGGFIDSQINNISVPGNHEYSGGLSTFWRPQFPYPDNGPGNPELKQTVYTVDYQGVRFIGLDTNVQGNATLMAAQTAWLEGLLKNNPNRWTVVTFHHPVYSTAAGRNNPVVRAQWGPLFEKYGVDLVLQGHDHTYGRGSVSSSRRSLTVHDSTVYAVSVSGGKMYEVDGSVWTGNGADIMSKAQDKQLYQLIDVSGDAIRYEARYANGQLHDGVTIRKNAAGERTVNELRTPENTTGEQATVDRTVVETRGRVTVSAYGYDPGEKVTVRLRDTTDGAGEDGVLVGYRKADELGRLEYTFALPPSAKKNSTHVVRLESRTQQITSPVITVTK
ncbi:metallophosphoesterase family protein [Micromonospora sp. C28SCA-DRY-2]|uniref:purple acid phosphatase family protein n=1 Tax=Micromonospora sp. C28SCA-DRY-2 TaxID=3059522 RepID=UPI002674F857|nr:metallophosphoesterase family protein [Micromonospora sp. C28SCA-DRY-2]MDO3702748.1 metallophosphoesterase family protein [Micromonospora sp. C28SCA-DRY-2]